MPPCFFSKFQNWFAEAELGAKSVWKSTPDDAVQREHHDADTAIGHQNHPEKLVKQLQIGVSLEYKSTVWEANKKSPEDEVEEGAVAEENIEGEVGHESELTTKHGVDMVR